MSELSKKRVRTSLKAIAQFKRACILSAVRSLSDVIMLSFWGSVYRKILAAYGDTMKNCI
jgi:hypothetical protein